MIRATIKSIDETMDLEDFYEQSDARRLSEEILFGSFWRDKINTAYELSWVIDTGELYLMHFPDGYINFTDTYGSFMTDDERWFVLDMFVLVIDIIPTEEEVRAKLLGWEEAMNQKNSIEWLYEHSP